MTFFTKMVKFVIRTYQHTIINRLMEFVMNFLLIHLTERYLDSLMPLQMKNIEKMAKRIAVDMTAEWSTSFQTTSVYEPDFVSEEQHREPVQTLFSPTALSTVESSDFVGFNCSELSHIVQLN